MPLSTAGGARVAWATATLSVRSLPDPSPTNACSFACLCSSKPPWEAATTQPPHPASIPPLAPWLPRHLRPRKQYQRAKAFGLGLLVHKPSIVRLAVDWRPAGAKLLG